MEIIENEAVDLLKELVGIPSFSREEKKRADYLEQYIIRKGYNVRRTYNNLYIFSTHWEENLPVVLLNAHIDTVKPVKTWTIDPFLPTESENGRIYGLGTNDDGASLVSLLYTFFLLDRKKQPCNYIFLASAEEEVSGRQGIEAVLPLLPKCAFALVGEPTGMHPAIAEKGLMVLDCVAQGKAGHAARNEGINAIYKAMTDIAWFSSYEFPQYSDLLGKVKMSVTVIQAGTQHNVVPDRCTFTVDVRSNEFYSNHDLYESICQHVQSEVTARSFRLNSSRISSDHPIIRQALSMGRKPFGSPTLSDQALISFPSFKMGPGDSARSHGADEYITRNEIKEAIELYVKLLDGFSL